MTILRKNASHLTDAEWQAFCNALLAMKKAGVYDGFVSRHAKASTTFEPIRAVSGNTQFRAEYYQTNGAHRGPSFLVWHRALLIEFETQLQQYIDSSFKGLGIPYWDWTQDPAGKSVFNKYLGTTTGEVTDGLFNAPDWCIDSSTNKSIGPLHRGLGKQPRSMPDMTTTMPVVMCCSVYDSFDSANFDQSFRRTFETKLHDLVHMWVGGQMQNPVLAPNDPIFYLHHANVDRLFTRWQEMHPTGTPYFQDPKVVMPQGQNYNDTLLQLNSTPQQVWDYKQMGYTYERPNTIRRFAGVSHSTYNYSIGSTSPVGVTFSPGSNVPSGTSAIQIGFTGWNIWFGDDGDHQLLRLGFDCNQAPYAGPVPSTLQAQLELTDVTENRPIQVQPQVSTLSLTDSSTFGALLVGRQTLPVSVSGSGECSWSATLTPPPGAEFAMAFFSAVDIQYSDASHWIYSEGVYINPMPTDSVPTQVKGTVHLWDASGNEKISAKLTLEVLYFGTTLLSSNLNYVLSGGINLSITTPAITTSVSSKTAFSVPEATVLTVPVIVGLGWHFIGADHNLRGNKFALTSTLSQLNYTGYVWDDSPGDIWDGFVHALVLCFSNYWV